MALGITTLVVLFLLISRFREGSAGAAANAHQTADEPPSAATIAKLPQPTGPTDEDEEEAEEAKGISKPQRRHGRVWAPRRCCPTTGSSPG